MVGTVFRLEIFLFLKDFIFLQTHFLSGHLSITNSFMSTLKT